MKQMKNYPVGMKIKNYPSSNGVFQATVAGYREEKNLNTGQITTIVRVTVHGTTAEGKQVNFEEGFALSYAPF